MRQGAVGRGLGSAVCCHGPVPWGTDGHRPCSQGRVLPWSMCALSLPGEVGPSQREATQRRVQEERDRRRDPTHTLPAAPLFPLGFWPGSSVHMGVGNWCRVDPLSDVAPPSLAAA